MKDKVNVEALIKNIKQRGNPFDLDQSRGRGIMNIATGAVLEKEKEHFYLHYDTLGKSARSEFYNTRLKEKSKQLLDNIPKTRKKEKKKNTVTKHDLTKQTVKFLRLIDYGRTMDLAQNKTALQQNFISWIVQKFETKNFHEQLFLGGSHKENADICLSYSDGSFRVDRLLECTHEEADDRVFFHANHAVKVGYYRSIVIVYCFCNTPLFGLEYI